MSMQASLPAWLQKQAVNISELPAWLADFRQQHWEAFLQAGVPTKNHERFKYTDFSFLANKHYSPATRMQTEHLLDGINQHRLQRGENILLVLVNGYFMPLLSDMSKLPEDVIVCNLNEALQKYAELIKTCWPVAIDAAKYPFASLNAATSTDGLFLYLPDHCELNACIHLLSLVIDQDEFIAHPQHVFVLGRNSKLRLADEHFTLSQRHYMMNIVTHISVGKDAQLDYDKIQNEGKQAIHMAHTFIQQMQNSQVAYTNFSIGGQFVRDDVVVHLEEPGAECRTAGFYHLRNANQYMDNHIDINHVAQRTNSEMLFKGVLENKSRAVFNGRLHVEKDAQKILAYQANHNLLLSKEAEVYSKPELEIYADDVKCKHGASIGQINEEALFYLCSRGIAQAEAMAMLLQGFAEEVVQRITNPGVRLRVQEIML